MDRLAPLMEREYPANATPTGVKIFATPLQERLVGQIRPAILVLAGAVVLLLGIVCFNVANLMLAPARMLPGSNISSGRLAYLACRHKGRIAVSAARFGFILPLLRNI